MNSFYESAVLIFLLAFTVYEIRQREYFQAVLSAMCFAIFAALSFFG